MKAALRRHGDGKGRRALIEPTKEILKAAFDPEGWQQKKIPGLKSKLLWEAEPGGASFAIVRFEKGSGIPTRHSHACNQFMFCVSGRYAYTSSGLILEAGSFYCNPKDNEHGPTEALADSILLEYYDGPHYYERPEYEFSDYTYRPGA